MLRINLLPPYIYDREKKIPFIIGSLALIPLTLVLMLMWGAKAQSELDEAKKRQSDAQEQKTQYDKFVSDINAEHATVAATKQKEDFVANSIKYNDSWPEVYTAMRDVTSPKVLLKSMYVSDDRKSINFTGWCPVEEDLVRWWMYLRAQSAMFTDVHFRLPDHPWPPKAEASAGGAGGGMMMGGSGGSAMSSGGMMTSGGGSLGPPPGGAMAPGISGMMMGGSGGMMGPGGGSFGGGGSSDAVGEEEIEGRKGIKFTASATLKNPLAGGIATPVWGTAGAASAGGSGVGGMMPMGSGGMASGNPNGPK